MLNLLGYGGMSSNETETEATRGSPKVLRRRDRLWHDGSLGRMWEAIENYDNIMLRRGQQEKIGNPGLKCLPPSSTDPVSEDAAVRFLPKNFYRLTWWFYLHKHDQFALHLKATSKTHSVWECKNHYELKG